MNIVSRSSAAGNSSIPPMANSVSGNTSVCITPALAASFSATLPTTAEACGVNESRPACTAVGFGLGGDAAFGDQQDPEDADQQDRALQEQRGRVDCDRSHHRGAADGSVQSPGQLHHRDERRRQPHQAEHHLHGVATLA